MSRHNDEDIELKEFRELYKSMAPSLIFYAAKFVGNIMAEDLVQDVFLKIWNKRAPLFLKEGLKTYLYRSVQHACLDYLKHEDIEDNYINSVINKLKIEEIYFNNETHFLFDEDERLSRIYEELDKLPSKCKEIFTMSYLEERKTDEIAELLNISKRTVEAQLYKALKRLRGAVVSLLF